VQWRWSRLGEGFGNAAAAGSGAILLEITLILLRLTTIIYWGFLNIRRIIWSLFSIVSTDQMHCISILVDFCVATAEQQQQITLADLHASRISRMPVRLEKIVIEAASLGEGVCFNEFLFHAAALHIFFGIVTRISLSHSKY
jgi:hypothetical protein